MKIIDEILPKVKAEVRLDKDNKTLWIKTDTLEGYGRIIIEDGANWCRIFYEECGECAHNDAEQTEPTISKMEQVEDEPQIVKKYDTFCGVPMAVAIKVMQKYKASKDEPTLEESLENAKLVGYQDGVKACNEEWLVRLGYKSQYGESQTDVYEYHNGEWERSE